MNTNPNPQPPTGEAAGVSESERKQWCEHVGGLGPPFPLCSICTDAAFVKEYDEKVAAGLWTPCSYGCCFHDEDGDSRMRPIGRRGRGKRPPTPEAGGDAGVRESIASKAIAVTAENWFAVGGRLIDKGIKVVPLADALALEAERDAASAGLEQLLQRAKGFGGWDNISAIFTRVEVAEQQLEIWEDLFGTTDAQHAKAELDRAQRSTVDPSALRGLVERLRGMARHRDILYEKGVGYCVDEIEKLLLKTERV